ncbi:MULTISPECIES: type II toxin-antitoxin system VapB family antitoxin [Idiomarina]|jgi:antitoxin VapB|uniref:AbrB/MazE/SpoVT family DNA-binding domain-containing protein n=1 Tax=Idiomarina abyssalis TaxID=86102 RepID=A0A8I1KGI6_9GAMM|nr:MULTISPECIES: type II toxin-antitoxin system VapB family antitoxin [Idiomarina]MAC32196.1 AbrB/MazE/SpoVT family DNA-binding domain-containing protein [Haliea sp.]KPD20998.1 antitoxin [Idiomarina abyssalis]MAO67095.1 AbrB/MazE/SpoVT family DNA-binding domain-containing protein [Idiomarina sp.]MBE93352.1 AbrB/MazE/SpoVT family DNA-binding domain-containing protein [Idiomarina sp.]MBF80217.1 AbrB/MazE/SpoVT family DNA-binding domain-containing protein [Idiomarina sp.]|tara:strand:- start:641 stop:871 length:231 start_codon:yes stop_codon:yes gene_type:complete
MAKTTVFKSNQTQAVRLPKDVAFSEDVREVEVLVVGESRIITPAKTSWASWFSGEPASSDFMVEREQPEEQERDPL